METEEQRKRRLELTQNMYEELYRREIYREMVMGIKRNVNRTPTISDKIPRLPNK